MKWAIIVLCLFAWGCQHDRDVNWKNGKWRYVKSDVGNCYEVNTMADGRESFTISGRVDAKHCIESK